MAKIDLIMPKMGESITEATILKWLKNVGDSVDLDESILEIATDKVDSDIPSPVSGIISEILFKENDVVQIGKVIARIATASGEQVKPTPAVPQAPEIEELPKKAEEQDYKAPVAKFNNGISENKSVVYEKKTPVISVNKAEYIPSQTNRFYSPLVRTIAQNESISVQELDSIHGTGSNGRVTKNDILDYVGSKSSHSEPIIEKESVIRIAQPSVIAERVVEEESIQAPIRNEVSTGATSMNGETEIIEMDRMRKLIAEHMVRSKHTSPHVTSFVEVDVTNIVEWREKNKNAFQNHYREKITYTPIFMEAVCKALRDYPMVNVSLDGDKIIKKNYINIGMAAALPSGNLIVPVIKNADTLNLLGLTKSVNDLANRARENKLKGDEIQNGTFTITNVGTFGNVMGTPIINQPQVAILAIGAIKKKPAVVETAMGDLIAVRHMMFLSLSYDHRVVDGYLGGSFLRKIADYMESFDKNRNI